MIFAGPLGIQRQIKLPVPVEGVAGAAEFVVAVAGARAVAGDIGGVGGDLVGDQAVAHILRIGQAQVLLGGHVAEHRRAVPAGHRRADGAGDVVVAGGNVGHERTEHVEGRLGALLHLLAHVELDLIHRHVARTLHHHLHVVLPGAARELTQGLQFGQLGFIGGVMQTTGPQRIPQREGAVVALEDLADVVEAGVQRVLLVVIEHPLGQDAATAAHNAGEAALHLGQVLDQQAGVDGLVVDALLAVLFDDVQEVVFRELLDRAVHALEGLIHRHRADRHRRGVDDRRAHLVEIDAAGGEIHHRVGAVLHRQLELLQLFTHIAGIGRGADVGVHLALGGDADGHRLQARVVDVGWDDHATPGHLFHHQRFGQVLPLRHMGHLLGDHPLPGVMHLGDIGLTLTLLDPGAAHGWAVAKETGCHWERPIEPPGVQSGSGAEFGLTSLRRHDPDQVRRV